MKEGQHCATNNSSEAHYLQEQLHKIGRAGYGIQHVLHCFNEIQRRKKGDEFSYLDLVEGPGLEDAMLILSEYVMEMTDELCTSFGLLRNR